MRDLTESIQRGAAALDQLNEAARGNIDEIAQMTGVGNNGSSADASLHTRTLADEQGGRRSQATQLLELCAGLELFHDAEQNGYAVLERGGHREVWPIESRAFVQLLEYRFYSRFRRAIGKDSVGEALGALQARARFESPVRPVFRRVAWQEGRIYLDLCNAAWQVIEIDARGWRVLDQSPVMFIRSEAMQALPIPVPGTLADLDRVLNVRSEDLPLVVGYLLMAARGKGPYPVLLVQGEQGSGKSTFTRFVRNLIDPSSVPLRGLTTDIRDLLVTATNNHVIVLDNLSGLSPQVSDILCRFATGGGFAERKLYTNREELVVDIQRPVILNGIDEIATRGDLLDRALVVHLPVISDSQRIEEEIAIKRYESLRPALLGGLCTALSHALRHLPHVYLDRKPRMADFATWVTAAESAIGWTPGTIMAAYWQHRDVALEAALETSPVAEALIQFMASRSRWQGTTSELLEVLERGASTNLTRVCASWPKTALGLTNALKRAAAVLRHHSIQVEDGKRAGHEGKRIKVITKIAKPSSALSASSAAVEEVKTGQGATAAISSTPMISIVSTLSAISASTDKLADNADAADSRIRRLLDGGEVEVEL